MTTNGFWGILASRLLQGLLVVFLVVSAVFVVAARSILSCATCARRPLS